MDHIDQVYWALGFIATGGIALFGFLWKHATNDRRHVSNGMSKDEIGADFRTLGVQIESVKEVLVDFRDEIRGQIDNLREQKGE